MNTPSPAPSRPPFAGIVLAAVVGLQLAAGCSPATDERTQVAAAVDSAVRAFRQADMDLDGQRVVDHLWPEFYMYADGVRSDYAQVRTNILSFMSGLRSFDTDWTDVEVVALGPNTALSSFRFRDSIVLSDGTLLQSEGPTTLLWERRGTEWKLLYADADHYPVGRPGDAGTP